MDQSTQLRAAGYSDSVLRELDASHFLNRVFAWMAAGLALTGAVAFYMATHPALIVQLVRQRPLFIGLMIGELALVASLAGWVQRMSASTAMCVFLLYSALNGVTISVLFLLYTQASIASTFFVTAATFAAMSAYGYSTQRDLTSIGSFCFMGLVGVIIGSLANLFMHSEAVYWMISYAGILVFVGLTAYDTQKLKRLRTSGAASADEGKKLAITGALILYLDFINLFILLLRLTGRRRD